jgi:hypothetical protein
MIIIITLLAILVVALASSLNTRSRSLAAVRIELQGMTLRLDTVLEEEYYASQREYYADSEAVGLEVALAEAYEDHIVTEHVCRVCDDAYLEVDMVGQSALCPSCETDVRGEYYMASVGQ